jgi:hypothetical protein
LICSAKASLRAFDVSNISSIAIPNRGVTSMLSLQLIAHPARIEHGIWFSIDEDKLYVSAPRFD